MSGIVIISPQASNILSNEKDIVKSRIDGRFIHVLIGENESTRIGPIFVYGMKEKLH